MQLSVNPHPGRPIVASLTLQANNRNTHGNITNERAHRPNRTRTRPHTASAERRHRFAVRQLMDWHQQHADVDARIPLLSAVLGHSDPASTYWYLESAPELFAIVGRRLEEFLGELP
jgi:hypothetical protein